MADGVVSGGEQKYFPNDEPKMLRGVMPVQLYLAECTDESKRRHTLLAIAIPPSPGDEESGDRYATFPMDTFSRMGLARGWLRDQLNHAINAQAGRIKTEAEQREPVSEAQQLPDDLEAISALGEGVSLDVELTTPA